MNAHLVFYMFKHTLFSYNGVSIFLLNLVTTTLPTTTTKPRDTGYDVIFMLDSSVPDEEVFNQMKDFASNIADRLSIDDEEYKIGIMRYSSRSDAIAQLNRLEKKNDVLREIQNISYRPGDSNLAAAMDDVRQNMFTGRNGDRDFARNLIVLLTGVDQSTNPYDAFRAAERAERDGINLYTVGFYLDDTFEIDDVSTHPLSTYRYLVNFRGDLNRVPVNLVASSKHIVFSFLQRFYKRYLCFYRNI